jgi:hypothetical protein
MIRRQGAARKEEHERESGLKKLVQIKQWVIVKLEQLDSFGNLSLDLKVSTFTTPSKVIMSCNLCTTVNVYVFLFTYYKVIWHA